MYVIFYLFVWSFGNQYSLLAVKVLHNFNDWWWFNLLLAKNILVSIFVLIYVLAEIQMDKLSTMDAIFMIGITRE